MVQAHKVVCDSVAHYAHVLPDAGAYCAEVPPGHSREVISICVQELVDEGGDQSGARLGHSCRQGVHGGFARQLS